tara:strand:+ start:147 stop:665 length:519 start_codon:yes stop_codon:yes gene_type:complete
MMLNLPYQLKLKRFTKKDITKKYLSFLNDKNLLKYSDQRHINHNYKTSIKYLNSFKKSQNLFLKIILNNNFIGTCTIYIDKHNQNANIGFLIGNQNIHNKGFASIILKYLIKYLFQKKKLNKISCGTIDQNYSMIKVCKKNKMFLDATLTNEKLIEKKFHNVLIYSILRKNK